MDEDKSISVKNDVVCADSFFATSSDPNQLASDSNHDMPSNRIYHQKFVTDYSDNDDDDDADNFFKKRLADVKQIEKFPEENFLEKKIQVNEQGRDDKLVKQENKLINLSNSADGESKIIIENNGMISNSCCLPENDSITRNSVTTIDASSFFDNTGSTIKAQPQHHIANSTQYWSYEKASTGQPNDKNGIKDSSSIDNNNDSYEQSTTRQPNGFRNSFLDESDYFNNKTSTRQPNVKDGRIIDSSPIDELDWSYKKASAWQPTDSDGTRNSFSPFNESDQSCKKVSTRQPDTEYDATKDLLHQPFANVAMETPFEDQLAEIHESAASFLDRYIESRLEQQEDFTGRTNAEHSTRDEDAIPIDPQESIGASLSSPIPATADGRLKSSKSAKTVSENNDKIMNKINTKESTGDSSLTARVGRSRLELLKLDSDLNDKWKFKGVRSKPADSDNRNSNRRVVYNNNNKSVDRDKTNGRDVAPLAIGKPPEPIKIDGNFRDFRNNNNINGSDVASLSIGKPPRTFDSTSRHQVPGRQPLRASNTRDVARRSTSSVGGNRGVKKAWAATEVDLRREVDLAGLLITASIGSANCRTKSAPHIQRRSSGGMQPSKKRVHRRNCHTPSFVDQSLFSSSIGF